MTHRGLAVVGRALFVSMGVVALSVLAFTIWSLLSGGWGAIEDFPLTDLQSGWPSLFAIAIVTASGLRSGRNAPLAELRVGTSVWAASGLVYLIKDGSFSINDVLITTIVSGVPVLLGVGALAVTRRASWSVVPRALLSVAVGLVAACLVVPMFIIVTCGLTGSCP